MDDRVLVIPEHRIGHGSGHLRRCLELTRGILAGGSTVVEWLLPEHPPQGWHSRKDAMALLGEEVAGVIWRDVPQGRYRQILVDRREMSLSEIRDLPEVELLVGFDAAGDLRRYADCVIDLLPTAPGVTPPNIADPGLLSLPGRVRDQWPQSPSRVLVVMGGEDRDGAALEAAAAVKFILPESSEVTVVLHTPDPSLSPGITVRKPGAGLRETLHQYDLVVTHYGLVTWEALWARVPVVTVNPGRYHQLLSDAAGLAGLSAVRDFPALVKRCVALRPAARTDPAALLGAFRRPAVVGSPLHTHRWHPALERFPDRTYFRDSTTGLVYMSLFSGKEMSYGHDYFFEEYRRQYGRTYVDDFDAIAATGRRRIADILSVATPRDPPLHLLDMGCAFGPFLAAAREAGCTVQGMDLNEEAVAYVRRELGIDAWQGDLTTLDAGEFHHRPDIVTMWYVIEHVPDLQDLLRRLRDILAPGGIFAFSTPHGAGISARRDRRRFLENSPRDHFSVWDRRSALVVLRDSGFRVRRIRVTGHHPERFSSRFPRWVRPLLLIWSRIAGLGDTFEVIAERVE